MVTSSLVEAEGFSDPRGVLRRPLVHVDPQQLRAPQPPGPISNEVLEDLCLVAIEEDCLTQRTPPVFIGRLYPACR
jgi:hypothetical protein